MVYLHAFFNQFVRRSSMDISIINTIFFGVNKCFFYLTFQPKFLNAQVKQKIKLCEVASNRGNCLFQPWVGKLQLTGRIGPAGSLLEVYI